MKIFSLGIAVSLLAINCHAASFDCHKASSFIEKAICKDSALSDLDSTLMHSYKKALEKSDKPNELKSEQKNWLKNTRNICQDSNCLNKVYHERINTLEQTYNDRSNKSTSSKKITGYTFSEEGYLGKMEISEISGCEITPNELGCSSERVLTAHISTLKKDNSSDCDVDAIEVPAARIKTGSNLEVLFVSKDKTDTETKFTATFKGKNVDIKDAYVGNNCGTGATIFGHWVQNN